MADYGMDGRRHIDISFDFRTLNEVEQARRAYRPALVRVLFVGESPPSNGTFFYFGDSNLARYTCDAFSGGSGKCRDVKAFLDAFRDRGFYLVDLCSVPVNGMPKPERRAARHAGGGELVDLLRELRPGRIVVVMKAIESHVRAAAQRADSGEVPMDVLPFPAYGHQRRYVDQLVEVLRHIGS